jgi:tRNA-dihydrouridine synthase B
MSLIRPLDIGSVRTSTNLVLAPMSGVTDCAFRTTVQRASGASVGLVVSEFVAAEGLTRDNAKTLAMLRYKPAERPVSIQIFGADVDRMVRAARMVEEVGADIVDVNCGCPAPKVVRRGGGAQLMREPDRLREIVAGIRKAVAIPVTVKIRSGWDDDSRNALDVARMVEGDGASMLAIHGRTRVQLYSGTPDWELVAEARSRLSIPVLGSGDVTDPETAMRYLGQGYADGILIGRGAIDNPWLFRQIHAVGEGRVPHRPDAAERIALMESFRDELRETKPDRAFLGRYRGLACRMVKGVPGGAAARRAFGEAAGVDEVLRLLSEFLLESASGRIADVA